MSISWPFSLHLDITLKLSKLAKRLSADRYNRQKQIWFLSALIRNFWVDEINLKKRVLVRESIKGFVSKKLLQAYKLFEVIHQLNDARTLNLEQVFHWLRVSEISLLKANPLASLQQNVNNTLMNQGEGEDFSSLLLDLHQILIILPIINAFFLFSRPWRVGNLEW